MEPGALNPHDGISAAEARIFRELYQPGCLLEKIELNRRKQQVRLSYADDKPISSSI